MSTLSQPQVFGGYIVHADLVAFAADVVNLRREDVADFRVQVARLREKLDVYASVHPTYGLVKSLLSGSLAKGLALRTLNDIDVALYLESQSTSVAESTLLSWLAERLREAYPQMNADQIQPGHHAVTIKYAVSGLNVDVVPILYNGSADDRGFLFTTDGAKPVMTSIPLHLAFTRKRKERAPTHFAQVVRLLKWWIRNQKAEDSSFRFKSFLAELIIAHLADAGTNLSDYCSALESVFGYIVKSRLKSRIFFTDYYSSSVLPTSNGQQMEIFDPVNPDNNVAADYGDDARQRIVNSAQDALEAIVEARYATTRGRAVDCWQLVFGPSFRG